MPHPAAEVIRPRAHTGIIKNRNLEPQRRGDAEKTLNLFIDAADIDKQKNSASPRLCGSKFFQVFPALMLR